MTSDHHKRITKLFREARELDPVARRDFLAGLDPESRTEVEALLAYDANICRAGERDKEPERPTPDAHLSETYLEDDDPEITLDVNGYQTLVIPTMRRLADRDQPMGRYRLKGIVDKGGMGVILRVWDEDLRRHVAMKVILGKGNAASNGRTPPVDMMRLQRFLEEAQITGQIDHPGVVPVHELGLDRSGRIYFTMRLVKGTTLKEVFDLVAEGREGWSPTRALHVILRACEAMAYAHSKGVLHRDIKPGNIMVGKFGQTYVMDWGLAKVLNRPDLHDIRIQPASTESRSAIRTERTKSEGDLETPLITMDGTVVGTPAYMAPEQARGAVQELGPQADVYSMGAVLYHLLAGHMPYVPRDTKISAHTLLARVLDGPPKRLMEINPRLPAELIAICEKAMARDSTARYSDMIEMAEDVRAYLEQRVVVAYRTGALAELKMWVRRNRAVAIMSSLILIGLVLVTMLGSYVARTREKVLAAEQQELWEQTEQCLAEGYRELYHGDLNEAIQHFQKALDDSKDTPEAVGGLALAYLRIDDPDQALYILDQHAALTDSHPILDVVRVDILESTGQEEEARTLGERIPPPSSAMDYYLAGLGEMQRAHRGNQEAYQLAEDLFEKAVLIAPKPRIFQYNELVHAAQHTNNAKLAEQLAVAMLKLWPDDPEALLSAANCLDVSGQPDEAISLYEKCLQLRPNWQRPLNNIGAILCDDLQDYDGAAEAFQKVIQLGPEDAMGHYNLGNALKGRGDIDLAVQSYREAIRLWNELEAERKDERSGIASYPYVVHTPPQHPTAYNNLGIALMDKGQVDEAITAYRNALRLQPDHTYALVNLGIALVEKEDFQGALEAYRNAVQLKPDDYYLRIRLGVLLCDNMHEHKAASEQFREAIRIRPDQSDVYYYLGTALRNDGALDEAITAFREALRLQSEDPRSHFYLALTLQAKEDFEGATRHFRKATQYKTDYFEAYQCLGVLLCDDRNDYDGAIMAFREALRIQPENSETHQTLGVALKHKGDIGSALAAFREAVRLDPANAYAQEHLTYALHYDLRQFDTALETYREALRHHPDNLFLRVNMGKLLSDDLKEYDEAVAAFREALRIAPHDPQAHYNLGLTMEKKGDEDGAVAAYREGVRCCPQDADLHNRLGLCLLSAVNLDGAEAEFKEAIKLRSSFAKAHYHLGLVFVARGDQAAAMETYRNALRHDPGFPEAHCNLGHALSRIGRFEEALEEFRLGHEYSLSRTDWDYPSEQWVEHCERIVELDRELEDLLVSGIEPQDPELKIRLALHCYYKKWYVLSATLYDELFTENQSLAEDRDNGHRYMSACSAALTAAGKGVGAGRLDGAARSAWRRKAFEWLNDEFAALQSDLKTGRISGESLRKMLDAWLEDRDLLGIREEQEIGEWSVEEQEACRAFWKEVKEYGT